MVSIYEWYKHASSCIPTVTSPSYMKLRTLIKYISLQSFLDANMIKVWVALVCTLFGQGTNEVHEVTTAWYIQAKFIASLSPPRRS